MVYISVTDILIGVLAATFIVIVLVVIELND